VTALNGNHTGAKKEGTQTKKNPQIKKKKSANERCANIERKKKE